MAIDIVCHYFFHLQNLCNNSNLVISLNIGSMMLPFQHFPWHLENVNDWKIMFDPSINMSRLMEKPTICIGENKDADQLRGNREADQRLCFRYSDSTIPPLLNSKISSF